MARKNPEPSTSVAFDSSDGDASERLLASALHEFGTKGFHAATTRAIGEGAGVSPAGVYVHYKAKSDLLFEIALRGHRACLAAVERVLAEASDDPRERLMRFVEEFARWHVMHQTLARVSQYELKSLPKRQHGRIVKIRRTFDEHLQRELRNGVEAGLFSSPDISTTATAILSLCIDLARWYEPGAKRSPDEIGRLYADLAYRMVARHDEPLAGAD